MDNLATRRDWPALAEDDEDRRTLAEHIADAIPAELTMTPHVGVGGARRARIAAAIMPVIEAAILSLLAERSAIIELQPGDTLCIGSLGRMSVSQKLLIRDSLAKLRVRAGITDVLLFETPLDLGVIRKGS